MTNGLRRAKKKRYKLYKLFKRSNNNNNLKKKYVKYRNTLTRILRRAEQDYYLGLVTNAAGDPKK